MEQTNCLQDEQHIVICSEAISFIAPFPSIWHLNGNSALGKSMTMCDATIKPWNYTGWLVLKQKTCMKIVHRKKWFLYYTLCDMLLTRPSDQWITAPLSLCSFNQSKQLWCWSKAKAQRDVPDGEVKIRKLHFLRGSMVSVQKPWREEIQKMSLQLLKVTTGKSVLPLRLSGSAIGWETWLSQNTKGASLTHFTLVQQKEMAREFIFYPEPTYLPQGGVLLKMKPWNHRYGKSIEDLKRLVMCLRDTNLLCLASRLWYHPGTS